LISPKFKEDTKKIESHLDYYIMVIDNDYLMRNNAQQKLKSPCALLRIYVIVVLKLFIGEIMLSFVPSTKLEKELKELHEFFV